MTVPPPSAPRLASLSRFCPCAAPPRMVDCLWLAEIRRAADRGMPEMTYSHLHIPQPPVRSDGL